MKNLYIIIFLLLASCTYCNAQTTLPEFGPHGAVWMYESIDKSTAPYAHYLDSMTVLNHDTTIAGRTCRIFALDGITQFYAYRDSLKIWGYPAFGPTSWTLLYDFNWDSGKIVALHNIHDFTDTIPAVVFNKSNIIVNVDTLPVLILHTTTYSSTFIVILNMGCINNTFIPNLGPYIPEFGGLALRCYHDTVIGTYKAPGVVVCDTDFHVGIPTILSPNTVQLYPNPATNEVRLLNAGGNMSFIEIHTIDGRIIKTIATPPETILLDGIADGMYIVGIHLKNGSVVSKKLVVQR
ncbi:MAG: T9SS type A sorting domain-containing protein [Flavipsychrobacter sp.]|nr:T9SS type A sorting domain-containing protein [Flavipsychrobacter sp.]